MADLHFRPLDPGDAAGLHAIMSDWQVVRQLGTWPWPPDTGFTAGRCRPYAGAGFVWGIFLGRALAGTVGVTEGVLGYCLARAHHGQGIGTAAATTALDHAFATTPLDNVAAEVWEDNAASTRVLARLGFAETGRQTLHALARGALVVSVAHRLTRARWQALRTAAGSSIAATCNPGTDP